MIIDRYDFSCRKFHLDWARWGTLHFDRKDPHLSLTSSLRNAYALPDYQGTYLKCSSGLSLLKHHRKHDQYAVRYQKPIGFPTLFYWTKLEELVYLDSYRNWVLLDKWFLLSHCLDLHRMSMEMVFRTDSISKLHKFVIGCTWNLDGTYHLMALNRRCCWNAKFSAIINR